MHLPNQRNHAVVTGVVLRIIEVNIADQKLLYKLAGKRVAFP